MPAVSERLPHAEGFVVSEANGRRSREQVTIGENGELYAGAVVGQVTANEKYVELDVAASNGSQNAAGILLSDVDGTDGDVEGVVLVRDAEVNGDSLRWPTGISDEQKAAAIEDLKALGIIVRSGPGTVETQTT